jgi:predicted metal-dependent peptidase
MSEEKTIQNTKPFSLEPVMYSLFQKERFYANLLLNFRVVYNDKDVPTAAIGVKNKEIVLYINTDFLRVRSTNFQSKVLKHEIFHLLLDHCGNRGKKYGSLNHKLKNIAKDCAINQYVGFDQEIEEDFKPVTLEGLRKQTGVNLEANQSWEYYYEILQKYCEENGKVEYVVDNHGKMEESDDIDGKGAINKAVIKDAIEKATKASAGNVPSEIASILNAFNESQLSWKQILRNFIAKSSASDKKMSRNKPNRRAGVDLPGYKKKRKLTVGVCADSSGSVCDESFSQFISEISCIAKKTSVTYYIEADCQITNMKTIKNGKIKKGELNERKGRGGTAYQPAIDACKKLNCDVIIYFGDMDSADKPEDPKVPFLWVRVGSSPPPASFGTVLDLKI